MTEPVRKDSKPKGILKTPSSDHSLEPDEQPENRKSMKWDEMNILATYHPSDKDYGHMKIDDPPTPYHRDSKCGSDHDDDQLSPENLASKLATASEQERRDICGEEDDASSEEDESETPEERVKRKSFEKKRKMHYNEFQAVKLARQLMQSGDDDEEEEDEDEECSHEPDSTSDVPAGGSVPGKA